MFDYIELATINHNNGRWYETPVGYLPSITTILGATQTEEKRLSLQSWRDGVGHEEADRITKEAADNGTMLHLLCERHLKNQKIDALIDGVPPSKKAMGCYNALRMKLNNITQVYGQEMALFSDHFRVAGRCDVAGEYEGVPSIMDFKTSRKLKSVKDVHDYFVQVAFYGAAHNEMYSTDIKQGVILMVSDLGFPQEFKVNLEDYHDELAERSANYWLATVNTP